jgi:hypothetical protein
MGADVLLKGNFWLLRFQMSLVRDSLKALKQQKHSIQ